MDIGEIVRYEDDNVNFRIGDYKLNIIFISFMPDNPEWRVENHCHSTFELHIIPKGHGALYTEWDSYDIKAGDMYITGPGIYHRQITDEENPMMEYCINFEMIKVKPTTGNELYSGREYNTLCETIMTTPFWYGNDGFGCREIMEKIYDEITNRRFGYRVNVRNLIAQLLVAYVRNFPSDATCEGMGEKTSYERRGYILDCRLYLDYDKPLTVDELSKSLFVSRRQLCRIIEKRYGMTFKEKLNSIRIHNAKLLLRESEMTVSEIAARVGFSSDDYFIRVFKSYEGKTPLKYRQSKMQKTE